MNTIRLLPVAVILFSTGIAAADPLPTQIGQCTSTTIKDVTTRLQDGTSNKPIPGSGSAVDFANGGYQVSLQLVKEGHSFDILKTLNPFHAHSQATTVDARSDSAVSTGASRNDGFGHSPPYRRIQKHL